MLSEVSDLTAKTFLTKTACTLLRQTGVAVCGSVVIILIAPGSQIATGPESHCPGSDRQ